MEKNREECTGKAYFSLESLSDELHRVSGLNFPENKVQNELKKSK